MYQFQLAQILLFIFVGFALPALGMILVAWMAQNILGYYRPNAVKTQPYECGMKPMQGAHGQFDVRYYLYALLFILFDIEVVFIIPWLMASDEVSKSMGQPFFGAIEITIFLAILAAGLVYAWKKGALEWE
ncbi:MAG TPA: NADH-quinone oxidoreductase subunit A [Planktothrix sp.]|jgi:NADH-quinone oxidoreductase subunit A